MQGTALLAAHLSRKLDYYHTRLTNDLLGILGPFSLNPVPSCSIASFEATGEGTVAVIPRGTEMSTSAAPACWFRTVYDVTTPAIALTASYTACVDAPLSLCLPPGAGGSITITIESKDPAVALGDAVTATLRVCIDTDAATRAALYDGLFARAMCTCVEAGQQWFKLEKSPFAPVGFSIGEALLPTPRRQEDSLRLLAEYFAFPEKFEFFDIDLQSVLAQSPRDTQRVVLHMIVPDLHRTSTPHLLSALPATALRLGCTPVVNMFARPAEPIRIREGQDDYPLTVQRTKDAESTIYSIDAMKHLPAGVESNAAADMLWAGALSAKQKNRWVFKLADATYGTETTVSFLDHRRRPHQLAKGTVAAQVTCTNGSLPASLPVGRAGGDLICKAIDATHSVRLLCTPTAPLVLADGPDDHFDVIAAGTATGRTMAQCDLPSLLEQLRLHARPDCAATERQLAGILAVEREEIQEWLPNDYGASLAYGFLFRLTIDEAAFSHRSIYAFAQVLDYVFGYYIARCNFTRLVLQSPDGRELVRCAQRPGAQSPA
jgi:type VI secretion system protein ImpG